MSVPTFTRRYNLLCALRGLALGLYGLGIVASAMAAPATSAADQSDAGPRESLPEVTVIGKMDRRTLNHVVNQFIASHAKPSAVISIVTLPAHAAVIRRPMLCAASCISSN